MRISYWSSDVGSSDLPLHARFVLRAGLRPIGVAEAAVAIVDPAGDRQEAFGIAEEGREARADLPDDAGAEGGGIVLLARRAGDAGAGSAEHDRDAGVEAEAGLEDSESVL